MLDEEARDVNDYELDSHEEFLKDRTIKISKVQSSLQKIHKMYETLNEIVQE